MANFNSAIDYLLINEGVTLFEDKQTGEISKYGISLRWLQTVQPAATTADIRALTKDAATALYLKYWWTPNKLDLIASDRVATKLFDACVNCGAETAVEIFQRTLNEPLSDYQPHLAIDGHIGPLVAEAVADECRLQNGEQDLLDAFCVNLVSHYEAIVAANPIQEKNLASWEARAEKLP